MKYSFTYAALALAAVGSASVIERDVALIKTVISENMADVAKLQTAADAFKGDKAPVVAAADEFIAHLKARKPDVEKSSMLTLLDAVAIATPVGDLGKASKTLVDTFKTKIPIVQNARECNTVRSKLTEINTNAQALIEAIIGRVDPSAQQAARSIASPLIASLKQAVTDYETCVDVAAPSSSAAPSSAKPSSAAPSSAAPSSAAPSSAAPSSAAPSSAAPSSAAPSSAKPSGSATPSASGSPSSAVPSSSAKPSGSGTPTDPDCTTTTIAVVKPTGCTSCPGGGNPPSGGNPPPVGGSNPTNPPPAVVTAGASLFAPAGSLVVAAIAAFAAL